MTTFLWVLFGLLALENIGRIVWLANGDAPRRTPEVIALDLVIGLFLMGWVGYLLAKGV